MELAAVLLQLQTLAMSASQRADFDSLRVACTLRQADALREAGNLEAAYNVMEPLVAERPKDPKALATMARLHTAAHDESQALLLYRRILQRTPDDLGTLLSAAGSASAMHEHAEAQGLIATALKQAPEQSTVLAAAGRVYRIAGDNTRAEQYLRAALAADAHALGRFTRGGLPEDSGLNTHRRANGAPVDSALAELQDLVAERSITLSAGTVFRNRAGETGLSQLSDMQLPIEARMPVGKGKIVLGAAPTFLDFGTVVSGYGVSSRFGAGPSAALAQA